LNIALSQILSVFHQNNADSKKATVTGVSIDSRNLEPGDLFFALAGEKVDGHDFLRKAFEKGAVAAVVSTEFQYSGEEILIHVSDPLLALQQLAAFYRNQFAIPVLALTGSNGKTTTKEMIGAVLSTQYKVAITPGNLNNHIGLPLSICRWPEDLDMAVLEMGTNHFGEIARLCEIAQPTHALITNIGKGHLEFFGDIKGVARAKKEILEGLPENGTAFLNGDDPGQKLMSEIVKKTITYGFAEACTVQGENEKINTEGFPFMQVQGQKILLQVPGRCNLMNALAAMAVGKEFGIKDENIKKALESFTAANQRMHLIQTGEITILNDCYNANPGSMEQAFLVCSEMAGYPRKIAVLGDMKELGRSAHEEHIALGRSVVSAGFEAIFGTGEEMRLTVEEAKKHGLKDSGWFESTETLLTALKKYLQDQDLILVKGSRSMKMEFIVDSLESN